ncbi:hypothetical protein J132_11156 [Termitomyces sp. J132]|nr:hypothetical protein J132_11156 [Termitomyces sp. J132]
MHALVIQNFPSDRFSVAMNLDVLSKLQFCLRPFAIGVKDLVLDEVSDEQKEIFFNLSQRKNSSDKRDNIKIKNRIDGETMCKYWTQFGKSATPWDLIYAIKKDNPEQQPLRYENNSHRMAELARNYHKDLQNKYKDVDESIREEKIEKALGVVRKCAMDSQNEDLGKPITQEEIRAALKDSKNASAQGLMELPTSFGSP